MGVEPDFSGYVTRYGVKCTDGRTIQPHAFKHQDTQQVPLVWQHLHDAPSNILGHMVLNHREDGVYAKAFFNDSPDAKHAKGLVKHKDIKNLSIYATRVVQTGMDVTHGDIKEGSLVLSGANPGAFIDNVNIMHAEGPQILVDEIIIHTGEDIVHGDGPADSGNTGTRVIPQKMKLSDLVHGDDPEDDPEDGDTTVEDVIGTMNEQQKQAMYGLVGHALQQSGINPTSQEGNPVVNAFDQSQKKTEGLTISHADKNALVHQARESGQTLKAVVEDYAFAHGIENIEQLFPFERDVQDTPEWITRRTEFVSTVLAGLRKIPFSRIRSRTADLTFDDARAKGYIKGNIKKEQYFKVANRTTTPTTVYKKQKLDRDDILDITDFSVVLWIQAEMRVMLDEELAGAVLVGDGRDVDDDDKIDEDKIRPILGDDPLYVTNVNVDLSDASSSADEIVDSIIANMIYYRGTGTPTLFTTLPYITKMLLAKDTQGRRLYNNKTDLANVMGVSAIIPVELMETRAPGVIGIIVNLADYSVGMDQGGQVSMFEQFDIDFNQEKYLIETRCSGAMTKYKGAVVLHEFSGAGGMLPDPTPPTFNKVSGVVTIPAIPSHVSYVVVNDTDGTEGSALTTGAQTAIAVGATVHIRAKAASTYAFQNDALEDWTFKRNPS